MTGRTPPSSPLNRKHLERLAESGRLTQEEAQAFMRATDRRQAEEIMNQVSARHAAEQLARASAEGRLTKREADDYLRRMRAGEHSHRLRAEIMRFSNGEP